MKAGAHLDFCKHTAAGLRVSEILLERQVATSRQPSLLQPESQPQRALRPFTSPVGCGTGTLYRTAAHRVDLGPRAS